MSLRILRSLVLSSRNVVFPLRKLSSTATPLLPNLSHEQITKIETTDKYLRTKHLEIEGNLSPSERDIARR